MHGSPSKHPTTTFDALLATASEEHNKNLQEEQQKQQPQPVQERLFQSFDTSDKTSKLVKQQKSDFARDCSPKRLRLESISPPTSPSSLSQSNKSKNSSRNRSRSSSQSSTSSSRSRSRSSSRSSRSSSTSSNDSGDESKTKKFKNKTLPTQPQLPLKTVTSAITTKTVPVSQNVPNYKIHIQNSGPNKTIQSAVVYNSHIVSQKNAVLISQKGNSAMIVQKQQGGKEQKSITPSVQTAYKMINPIVSKVTTPSSNSGQKNRTVINNPSIPGGGVKFITGLSGQSIGNHSSQLPVQMALLPQNSNGVAQGYQLVTFSPQTSGSSNKSASQQKNVVVTSSKPSTSRSNNSGISCQSSSSHDTKRQTSQSKQASASNVPKYTSIQSTCSNSLNVGNIVGSTHSKLSDIPKPKATLHTLNASSNLPLMFNHGLPSHLVPVAAFQHQSSSQTLATSHQKSQSSKLSSPTHLTSLHSATPSIQPQPAHTPIPRIYTPSPGSNTPNILTELSHDRRSQIQGQSLLIPSNLSQLSNSGVFNLGQFSHQPFTGDHASLATVTGIRPNESGDAHHAIRVQGYQGLATQRLAMYSDQAGASLRQDFPVYRPAGGKNLYLLYLLTFVECWLNSLSLLVN